MLRRGSWTGRVPRVVLSAAVCLVCLMTVSGTVRAASKSVDLDGQSSNGNESRCDLNVLSTFPVKIENVVTNKALGDAFDFKWPSGGPGGFTSSAAAGTSGGVGAKWTWTTNQSVFSFTGSTCEKDICFLQTMGPDPLDGTCSLGCADDGVTLTAAKGAGGGDLVLNWTGGDPSYTVFRSGTPDAVPAPENEIGSTSGQQYTDSAGGSQTAFYLVRGATCLSRKSCVSDAECNPVTEGSCFSRGPFSVPGRSLTGTDITVSSASLTSSVITFFSPPTEVFRATSIAQPFGSIVEYTNNSTAPATSRTEDFPPGCCPEDPNVPQQLRCEDECVDYLNDPQNCGACGNVCDSDQCCTNGNCVDLCPAGQVLCNGECVDLLNDSDNCGTCGSVCPADACCNGGVCDAFCESGDTWCGNGVCADLLNDATNCGACGNDCGEGSCCSDGSCESLCDPDRTYCSDGLCYDLLNDPNNCGACGNSCGDRAICDNGQCVPCDGTGGARYACDNRCVNLNTDPYNCGACGAACELECPSGFTGVCSQGQSCRCEEGDPAPPPPPNTPVPTDPFCPNPNPSDPVPGGCSNPNPTSPQPAVCPDPGPPAPQVPVAPICQVVGEEQTIMPGETVTICEPGGLLFRELPTVLTVCGDTIPGPDGTCGSSISNVASGTFIRFVPDTETQVGDAFVTPFAVHVTSDDSNDSLIAPGETATLVVDVLNAGPVDILDASATLISNLVDLTDDGVHNPVALTILNGSSPYGTIAGTQPPPECEPAVLQPAANQVEFEILVPQGHPEDTSHPTTLRFTGTVNGAAYEMDMPFSLGIVDRCVYADATRDFDGIDGLLPPMAELVPEGDPPPFPSKALNAGKTAPLKMRQFCGGVELRGADVDPPEVVGLSEADLGDLDILSLHLNDDSDPDDLFFRWNDSVKQWIFNMRTSELGVGVFTLKIRVAGRKDYLTGFELR